MAKKKKSAKVVVARLRSSPYASPPTTLRIGADLRFYYIPEVLLQSLGDLVHYGFGNREIHLPDVDVDTGHVLVHYLHSGAYQTLADDDDAVGKFCATTEFRKAVVVCVAAAKYKLPALQELAKAEAERWAADISISDIVQVVSEDVFVRLQEDSPWFQDLVVHKVETAVKTCDDVFSTTDFFGSVASPALVKLLAQRVATLYHTEILELRRRVSLRSAGAHSSSVVANGDGVPLDIRLPPPTGESSKVKSMSTPEPAVDETVAEASVDDWGFGVKFTKKKKKAMVVPPSPPPALEVVEPEPPSEPPVDNTVVEVPDDPWGFGSVSGKKKKKKATALQSNSPPLPEVIEPEPVVEALEPEPPFEPMVDNTIVEALVSIWGSSSSSKKKKKKKAVAVPLSPSPEFFIVEPIVESEQVPEPQPEMPEEALVEEAVPPPVEEAPYEEEPPAEEAPPSDVIAEPSVDIPEAIPMLDCGAPVSDPFAGLSKSQKKKLEKKLKDEAHMKEFIAAQEEEAIEAAVREAIDRSLDAPWPVPRAAPVEIEPVFESAPPAPPPEDDPWGGGWGVTASAIKEKKKGSKKNKIGIFDPHLEPEVIVDATTVEPEPVSESALPAPLPEDNSWGDWGVAVSTGKKKKKKKGKGDTFDDPPPPSPPPPPEPEVFTDSDLIEPEQPVIDTEVIEPVVEIPTAQDNDDCPWRLEHLSAGDGWRECEPCELYMRKIASKLHAAGLSTVNDFGVIA